jgi:hypothetical protein
MPISADIFTQPIPESPFNTSIIHAIKYNSLDSLIGELILSILEGRLEQAVFRNRRNGSDLGVIVEEKAVNASMS